MVADNAKPGWWRMNGAENQWKYKWNWEEGSWRLFEELHALYIGEKTAHYMPNQVEWIINWLLSKCDSCRWHGGTFM